MVSNCRFSMNMTPLWIGKCLHLLLYMSVTAEGSRRKKREWILPATKLLENVDYTKQEFIAKIWSDKHTEVSPVEYRLTGRGADMEPYNLFIVNPHNGLVRITGILDREEISQYHLTGLAKYKNGSLAEGEVHLKIQVLDQNDNPPKFSLYQGSVKECSNIGTPVMQIKADDADEPGTVHTKIAYSIVQQIPEGSGGMFSINRDTGEIYVKQHTLDRETLDSYTLIVQGVDMDGAPNGNTGTGTVQIKVLDINDNILTLEKDEYTGNVDEGAVDVVVMRIKALDKDLENTDNWFALFEIIKGNEDGVFSIETDPKTNEGVLKLVKPVDYEKVKELNLGLVISNVAAFVNDGTATSLDSDKSLGGTEAGLGTDKADERQLTQGGKMYSVKVFVNNLSDGLVFSPSVKVFPVSEDPEKIQVPKIIGSFPAMDGDTLQIAENVRYAKGYDPDNWLSINEQTSEIKLVKTPDRESTFLVNGTYFAKIICMTQDVPPRTATGTIALKVEDTNDNCPKLTSTYQSVCSDEKVINVTAFDEDVDPNGEPYKFVLIEEETSGKWETVPVNGTTVSFHAQELLWPGFYELTVEIFDVKGLGCADRQKLQVEVCTCEEGDACVVALRTAQRRVSSVKVGVPAMGLLMAGVALLMLIPMFLLVCQCGAVNEFMELPFDAKEQLISYHTEGKGEDKEVPLLSVPDQQSKAVAGNAGSNVSMMLSHIRGQVMEIDTMFEYQNNAFSFEHPRSNPYSSLFRHDVQDIYGGIALPDDYLHGYFIQKARHEAANPPPTDSMVVYNSEGQDSPVGSLGCCSLLETDNNLAFLNNLGPKFMALAEICSPPKPCLPSSDAESSVNALNTSIKTESLVTTNIAQDTKSVIPSPDQDNAHTKALNNNSDNLSTMHSSQIQVVQQQQPIYYLVEHQVPTTVILAEGPTYGAYLLNGSAASGGLILQDSTNPSSPESPTLPTVWFQGSQECFPHHELHSTPKIVLVQSECNVAPTVLSQAGTKNNIQGTDSGCPVANTELGNDVLVRDCSSLDPEGPTQAQAESQIRESSLKISQERGSENVFMLRHDTMNLSQPDAEDALAEHANMKEDSTQFRLASPLGKGQENIEEFLNRVSTDDTDSIAQNIVPSVINAMPSIFPDILIAKSSTEDVLAKASLIQKELEQTLLTEGFKKNVSFTRQSKSAANISSVGDDLPSKIQKDTVDFECEASEPNLTVMDASVLPHATELNGTGLVVSSETLTETVLGDNVPSVDQSLQGDDTLIECSMRPSKTETVNPSDLEEFTIELVDSPSAGDDSPVTGQTDLIMHYASHQELADDLENTLETPQDISGVSPRLHREIEAASGFPVTLLTVGIKEDLHQQNLEDESDQELFKALEVNFETTGQHTALMTLGVDAEVKDTTEVQVTLRTEEIKEDLHQHNSEDVKKNEHVLNDVFLSVIPLEEVSVTVPQIQFGENMGIHSEQSLLTLDLEQDTELASSDSEKEGVGDELQPEDTHMMDQEQTAAVKLKDELEAELVEALDVHFKTQKQDIAWMNVGVETEVGDTTEVQVTSHREEIKEDLHQQSLEDGKKNEHDINDVSFSLLEEANVTMPKEHFEETKEIHSEQSLLTLNPDEDTELASFDSEKEDAVDELKSHTHTMDQKQTAAIELSNESDRELDNILNVNFPTPKEDISWKTSEVSATVGDITEVQVTSLAMEGNKPQYEEVLDQIKDAHQINMDVNWFEEISMTVEERNSLHKQNLCTLHSEEKFKLTGLKSEEVDGVDLRPPSKQRTEDTSVMEQVETAAVGMNEESDPQYHDCDIQLSAAAEADHQGNEEVDLEEVISGSSEAYTSTETGMLDIQHCMITSKSDTVDELQQVVLHPQLRKQSEEIMENNKRHDDDVVNVLLCKRQGSEDLSEQDTHQMSEQDVHSSSPQADSQYKTGNTVNIKQNIPAAHITSGYTKNESGSLSIRSQSVDREGESKFSSGDPEENTETFQSALTKLSSVQDEAEYNDTEVQQTLPQVVLGETKVIALQSGLSEEGKGATIASSEGLTQEQDVLGEKAVNMSSEAMEQVLTTANSMPASGAADLQAESEQEANVIPKNKHRNSKKSAKKVMSPKSPLGKCKAQ